MRRNSSPQRRQHSASDHRPMLPEFREPRKLLDAAIREHRKTDKLLAPKDFINWR